MDIYFVHKLTSYVPQLPVEFLDDKKILFNNYMVNHNRHLLRFYLKVWKQKKVWEGFVKCCQRTKPQSFQVLLQLPAPQLADALESSPDLRQPLKEHVLGFSDNQVSL